jgi:hypothetical protein
VRRRGIESFLSQEILVVFSHSFLRYIFKKVESARRWNKPNRSSHSLIYESSLHTISEVVEVLLRIARKTWWSTRRHTRRRAFLS